MTECLRHISEISGIFVRTRVSATASKPVKSNHEEIILLKNLFLQKPGLHEKQHDGLFVDDTFPAKTESIFRKKTLNKTVVWKRPGVQLLFFTNYLYFNIIQEPMPHPKHMIVAEPHFLRKVPNGNCRTYM